MNLEYIRLRDLFLMKTIMTCTSLVIFLRIFDIPELKTIDLGHAKIVECISNHDSLSGKYSIAMIKTDNGSDLKVKIRNCSPDIRVRYYKRYRYV